MFGEYHDASFHWIVVDVAKFLPDYVWAVKDDRMVVPLPGLVLAVGLILTGIEGEVVEQPLTA